MKAAEAPSPEEPAEVEKMVSEGPAEAPPVIEPVVAFVDTLTPSSDDVSDPPEAVVVPPQPPPPLPPLPEPVEDANAPMEAPEAKANRALVQEQERQVIQIDAETVNLRDLVKAHRLGRLDKYAAKKRWTPGLKPPDLTPQERLWWKEWDQANNAPAPAPVPPSPPKQ